MVCFKPPNNLTFVMHSVVSFLFFCCESELVYHRQEWMRVERLGSLSSTSTIIIPYSFAAYSNVYSSKKNSLF